MKLNKIIIMLVVAAAPLMSKAGLNVQWTIGYGVYPFGAPDPTAFDSGSGLLANNGSGSTILQLLFTPSGVVGAVDPFAVGYVSGDNSVLATINVTDGVAGYDEWVYNGTVPQYVNPTFTAGYFFMRVFQDATPEVGEYYFDSATLAALDVGSDISVAQQLYLEPDPSNSGVALNLEIVPEPSVLAFLGLGGLALAARRRFVA